PMAIYVRCRDSLVFPRTNNSCRPHPAMANSPTTPIRFGPSEQSIIEEEPFSPCDTFLAPMRVIAGTYRSPVLKSLKGLALRPTSDRLRETLFNVLGPGIEGSRFVDLFAGTGAIGIEALSRGAAEVVFVENHAPAATLIRKNL